MKVLDALPVSTRALTQYAAITLGAFVLLAPEPLLPESKAEEEASVWPPEAQQRRVWRPQGGQRAEPEPLPLPSFA